MRLHVVQRADRSLTFSYVLYVRPSVRCPPYTNCGHLTLFMKTHFPIRCNRNFFYIRLFLEHVSGEPHLQRRTRKWLQELWLPRGSRAFIFIFRIVVDVGDVEEGRVKLQWTCFIVVSMVCSSAAGLSVRPGCFLLHSSYNCWFHWLFVECWISFWTIFNYDLWLELGLWKRFHCQKPEEHFFGMINVWVPVFYDRRSLFVQAIGGVAL